MARQRRKGRPCKFESLESRYLLAGDVTASIHNGDLVIKGDDLANGITITAGATAGTVVITGVNAGGSATRVNGSSNGAVTLSGFIDDLKINMKGGADSVSISDLEVHGKAELKGGDGDDTFTIDGATFDSSLKVRLGQGDDTLTVTDAKVAGKGRIKGKSGDDDVTIDGSTFTKLRVGLGRDDDTLDISDTTASVKTRLNGGHGTNTLTNGTGNTLTNLKIKNFNQGDSDSTPPSETAPTLAINGATSVNEGSLFTLNLSSTGPGADTITKWTITWGDGSAAQDIAGDPSTATHTFVDGPATRTISAKATNPDGTFNSNTITVTVANANPVATIGGAPTLSVTEGTAVSLTGSFTDAGTADDPHTFLWHVVAGNGQTIADATTQNFSFTPNDNGSYTVTFKVTDKDGGSTTDTKTITVANANPVATIGGAPVLSVTEGTAVSLTGSFTDAGTADDPHTFLWHVVAGNGQTIADATTQNFSFTPNDNGSYTVTFKVTDKDGGSSTDTKTITVANANPAATIGGAPTESITEGTSVSLTGAFTDAGSVDNPHTFLWHVVAGNGQTIADATTQNFSFTPNDNGSYTVTFKVTDKDGGSTTDTKTITVVNANPAATIGGAPGASIDEGTAVNLTGGFTDAGSVDDPHTFLWHVVASNGQTIADATTQNFSFTPNDDGTYTVTFKVTDKDGGSTTDTKTVTATNVSPAPAIEGASATIFPEGTPIDLTCTPHDPGTADTFSYEWSVTKNGNLYDVGTTDNFSFTPDDDGTYVVSLTVLDDDGDAGNATDQTIIVGNVVPQNLEIIRGLANLTEGTPIDLFSNFDDPGTADTFTYHWNVAKNGSPYSSGSSSSFSFTPDDDGTYVVTLRVADDDMSGDFAAGVDGTDFVETTATFTVANVAPTVEITGLLVVKEGTTASWTLAPIVDPGADTVTNYVIHWGDSNTDSFTAAQITTSGGVISHKYVDGPNDYTITVDLVDEDGTHAGAGTLDITVNNVAPAVDVSGPTVVDEGTPSTWNLGPVVDPGVDTVSQYVIHWGDGNTDTFTPAQIAGMSNAIGHTYADGQNNYTISVDLVDEDGTFLAAGALDVTVNNVAPFVDITGPVVVKEGTTGSWELGPIVDPGTDTVTNYVIHWGDGNTESFTVAQIATLSGVISHKYVDGPNNYTIAVDLVDEDGTFLAVDTLSVAVNNVAPTVEITGPSTVKEGTTASWTLAPIVDPGTDTVASYVVHWGDGSVDATFTADEIAAMDGVISHKYVDGPNNYTITVGLVDEDGTYLGAGTLNITVNNVAPTVEITGLSTVKEGTTASWTLAPIADPGADTVTNYVIHWGDGSADATFTAAEIAAVSGVISHKYVDGPSNYTISVDLVDEDSTYLGAGTLNITVNNVAPSLEISGSATASIGVAYTLNLSRNDPGTDTIQKWTITWGDGSPAEDFAGNPSSVAHTYTSGGSNSISATATDEDGLFNAIGSFDVTVS